MRGSIWTIAALGIGAVMTPLLLDINVDGDETGETALTVLSSVDAVIGPAFIVAVFGLLTVFFTTDSGF